MESTSNNVRLILLLLTCTAGAVDANAYFRLGQVFPANMSGNTVLLALRLGGAEPSPVVGNLIALLGYCIGAAIAAIILARRERQNALTQSVPRILIVEVILMGLVALLWQIGRDALELLMIGLSCLAMGMQSAMAGTIAVQGVSTITITNTLTNAIGGLVRFIRSTLNLSLFPEMRN